MLIYIYFNNFYESICRKDECSMPWRTRVYIYIYSVVYISLIYSFSKYYGPVLDIPNQLADRTLSELFWCSRYWSAHKPISTFLDYLFIYFDITMVCTTHTHTPEMLHCFEILRKIFLYFPSRTRIHRYIIYMKLASERYICCHSDVVTLCTCWIYVFLSALPLGMLCACVCVCNFLWVCVCVCQCADVFSKTFCHKIRGPWSLFRLKVLNENWIIL